jgi:hypothetical protein
MGDGSTGTTGFTIENLRRISVEPGDIFVMKIGFGFRADHCETILEQWRAVFGDEHKLIFMTDDADLSTYRPVSTGDHTCACGCKCGREQ